MNELVPAIIVVIAFGTPLLAIARSVGGQQAALAMASVVVHIVAAIAMVTVVREYYGYGDLLAYWRGAVRISAAISFDYSTLGDVFLLIGQRPNTLQVIGNGWSTGSMYGLSGLLAWLLDGSLLAMCVLVSLVGCASRIWLFTSLRPLLPKASATALAVVCLLIPSVVFWTAGILKEGFATPALAFATGAVARYLSRRMRLEITLIIVGISSVMIALVKAYILFPFAAAGVAGFLCWRAIRTDGSIRISFGRLAVGGVAIVAFVLVLGSIFPKYSLERFADTAEDLRVLGDTHAGGSTTRVAVGGNPAIVAATGLATALFRPLLFEVKNPLMLVSAAEASVFLFLFLRLAFRYRWVFAVALRKSWLFVFCGVFVLAFGVAVGMTTTNLGTLARYRVPMLPFLGVSFVLLESVINRPFMRQRKNT